MKSIFAFCLVLGLVFGANSAFSLTKTKTYSQSMGVPGTVGGGMSGGGVSEATYWNVDIDCHDVACGLVCYDPGSKYCDWGNVRNCTGCEGDMFQDGNGQDMFDHAIAQIDASVNSGTYVNNILPPGGTHYFRSITWGLNSSSSQYVLTLTLTEVTP